METFKRGRDMMTFLSSSTVEGIWVEELERGLVTEWP